MPTHDFDVITGPSTPRPTGTPPAGSQQTQPSGPQRPDAARHG